MGRSILINQWKIVGAKIQGSYHLKTNIPCQDSFSIKAHPSFYGCVVADGAGFSAYAELTAKLITKYCIKFLCRDFDYYYSLEPELRKEKILLKLRTALRKKADRLKINFSELACTLLFVVIKEGRCMIGHIGDGIIGVETNQSLDYLSLPENGEHINETFFINSENAINHFRLYAININEIKGFIIMTDGSYESLFNHQTKKFAKGAYKMLEWFNHYTIEIIQNALEENMINISKKTSDDCTVVIMKLKET